MNRRLSPRARASDASRWGAYCLANDAVLDWVLPLVESLATFAPDLPLLFIPFDERTSRLEAIAERFGHGLFEHAEVERLEAAGRRFYADSDFDARGFRKLAAFQGPFERFFSLDSDVVCLGPLGDLQTSFESAALDLLYFDTDLDNAYRPGSWREARVARGARGFNAGVFAARRGSLDAERLSRTLAALPDDWRSVLVPNAEQPFLNFYAEEERWRIAGAHELVADTCSTCWAAVGRLEPHADGYRLRDSGRWDEGWRIRFAHWAGIRLAPDMPNRAAHQHFLAAAKARMESGAGSRERGET